jgi:hypothetical protein
VSIDVSLNFTKMRDTKTIEKFLKIKEQKTKENNIFRNLRKEVNYGANGTQKYVIKKGINKGKVAE